jgi:dTDP-4-dehydrorhamnose 3,5-epimerase
VKIKQTKLEGSHLIELEPIRDERGMFARRFCVNEFSAHGLETRFVQSNISENYNKGTLRGMHFQEHPHAEVKIVRCVLGAVYDVIVDIRKNSQTYLSWFGSELSQENGSMMYVPQGFAHGYQTLTPSSTVHYMVSEFYKQNSENGLRYDDPAISINWPLAVSSISQKDMRWPLIHQ